MLSEGCFSESSLRESLPDLMGLPWRRRALAARLTGDTMQSVLARLFIGEISVSEDEAFEVLGESGVTALEAAGLLTLQQGSCEAAVGLTPRDEYVLAHDRRGDHRAGMADYVPGPGPATSWFADRVIRRPVEATLDLGCGQGALGILAAENSASVVATDLNERALSLCKFNAELNRVGNLEVSCGDWFAAVPGRTFDLILCNPPYVISPSRTFMYRDGTSSGSSGIYDRIVGEAPSHLAEDGTLQMACNWPHYVDRDWKDDMARSFTASGCDVWILTSERASPAAYADAWLRQEFTDEDELDAEFERWVTFFETERIEEIGSGLVVMRRVSGRTPWFAIRDMPSTSGACGESIARTLDARDHVSRLAGDAALLDARFRLSPDCVQVVARRATGDGWQLAHNEVRLTRGISFAASIDPVVAGVIGLLDGTRSLRQAADAFAATHGVPTEPLLTTLLATVRKLADLGLLLPEP